MLQYHFKSLQKEHNHCHLLYNLQLCVPEPCSFTIGHHRSLGVGMLPGTAETKHHHLLGTTSSQVSTPTGLIMATSTSSTGDTPSLPASPLLSGARRATSAMLNRPTRHVYKVDSVTQDGYVRLNQYKLTRQLGQVDIVISLNTFLNKSSYCHKPIKFLQPTKNRN